MICESQELKTGESSYYHVYFYKDEDGSVTIDASAQFWGRGNKNKILIEEVSKPANYDFSYMPDDEILDKLNPLLDKFFVDSNARKPFEIEVLKDLRKILDEAKTTSFKVPDFLGGRGEYSIAYHQAENGMIEIKSHVNRMSDWVDKNSIAILKNKRPFSFDFRSLTREQILHDLKPQIDKVDDVDENQKDCITTLILDSLCEAKKGFSDSDDVPIFLGGSLNYTVEYGMAKSNDPSDEVKPKLFRETFDRGWCKRKCTKDCIDPLFKLMKRDDCPCSPPQKKSKTLGSSAEPVSDLDFNNPNLP